MRVVNVQMKGLEEHLDEITCGAISSEENHRRRLQILVLSWTGVLCSSEAGQFEPILIAELGVEPRERSFHDVVK